MQTRYQPLSLILLACMIPLALPEARGAQAGREAVYNRQGLEYFNEGFYHRLPKGQQREADQAFDLAAVEFQRAVALKPDFVEAHRNLARLYYVRKQYAEAASSYRNVARLAPRDLDAYVQLALACIELRQFDEAIRQLSIAKTQTADEGAIRKLDSYIQTIQERR
jgi:tetratricopeptide (TPR) repeat protein